MSLGLLAASLFTPLRAQEVESPLAPAGRLRIEGVGVFQSWDRRFGVLGPEPLETDLTDPSGALLFPGISALESTLAAWLGDPDFEAVLGRSRADVSASRIRVPLSMALGITDWLTIGVTVPMVQNRTEVEFAFRADSATANLGVNPAVTRPQDVVLFTDELRTRQSAASTRATQLCAQDPASTQCTAATDVAREGQSLLTGFLSSYSASAFYPLLSSNAAAVLRQRVAAFNQGLASLELATLATQPLFATTRVTREELEQLMSDAAVGINALPLSDQVGIWQLGDVEVNVALKLLEGGQSESPAVRPELAYQVGGSALVRLGTGTIDDPDVFLDLPSGDGQMDIEGRLFSNLRSGRWGLWSDARYGVQESRTIERRIGPPELVLVPAVNRTTVEWTPGNYLAFEVSPRYHLSEALSITAGYRLFAKEADSFVRVSAPPDPGNAPPIPSPPLFTDVSLLAQGTEETSHEVGGGLLFSTLDAWQAGLASRPFEARFNLRWAVAGSGLEVPKGVRAEVGLRLYVGLWN